LGEGGVLNSPILPRKRGRARRRGAASGQADGNVQKVQAGHVESRAGLGVAMVVGALFPPLE